MALGMDLEQQINRSYMLRERADISALLRIK